MKTKAEAFDPKSAAPLKEALQHALDELKAPAPDLTQKSQAKQDVAEAEAPKVPVASVLTVTVTDPNLSSQTLKRDFFHNDKKVFLRRLYDYLGKVLSGTAHGSGASISLSHEEKEITHTY